MKILQLCKKFPYPAKDGESLAILNLGKALAQQGVELHLLAMNTSRHRVDIDKEAAPLQHYASIQTVFIDNRIKPKDAFLNLFSKQSYHISRFVHPHFEESLVTLLQEHSFDIVQLETLYLTPYISQIRHFSNAEVALRAHNIEFEIWERVVQNTPQGLKKMYLAYLTRKLKQYEIRQLDQLDLLIPISDRDRQYFHRLGYQGREVTIPIGVDAAAYTPDWESLSEGLDLAFIGSLDWMPNMEGLKWFLEDVWPKLTVQFPEIRLHIAGRNTPSWLQRLNQPRIVVHGEVPDARAFINSNPIMIVPLLSGSGMRVKILEGMALGRLVLTTRLGLEGIPAQHSKEVMIADKVDEFLNALEYLREQSRLLQIGQNARKLIEDQFDNIQIGKKLLEVYERMMMTKV
jgi:glycosyltransferase involved in cell wall biosynthesis